MISSPSRSSLGRRLNFYCQMIIILLGVIALRLWITPVEALPRAQAQFMDSGAQRLRLIQETERTNRILEQMHATLKGTLRVRMEQEAKNRRRSEPRPPTP